MSDKPEVKSEWSVELYKEFCALHDRNYLQDNLWGDKSTPSKDYLRFIELEQAFLPLDNCKLMFQAFEAQALEIAELKRQLEFREKANAKLEAQNKKLIEALKLASEILNKNSIYSGDLAELNKLLKELER